MSNQKLANQFEKFNSIIEQLKEKAQSYEKQRKSELGKSYTENDFIKDISYYIQFIERVRDLYQTPHYNTKFDAQTEDVQQQVIDEINAIEGICREINKCFLKGNSQPKGNYENDIAHCTTIIDQSLKMR